LLTLPTLLYLETLEQGGELARSLREQRVEERELEGIIEHVRTSSAIDRSMQKAQVFIERGEELLSLMPETPEREALTDIARYVVRRNL
jgi:heptaprenyl diphosphate synthase